MPCFNDFNVENKLRIPLSAYAAQVIENDCQAFSQKKTTLINLVIMNYYQRANCTISLRLRDFQNELTACLNYKKQGEDMINKFVEGRAKKLTGLYAKKRPSDVNLQIRLNNSVKKLLTCDAYTYEERYYGQHPGRYVRSLIEEYAQLPYHQREEIIYKEILDTIATGIKGKYILNLTNEKGSQISIRPYSIETDPLSTFHYLIGYRVPRTVWSKNISVKNPDKLLSIRISRLVNVEIQYLQSVPITTLEEMQIKNELKEKSVQFLSGDNSVIRVLLTDAGIKKYSSQIHLRPNATGKDPHNDHIYIFECTEAQIFYYFFSFGKEAIILEPQSLVKKFSNGYKEALLQYDS